MTPQEQLRQETHRYLHQLLMQLYQSYTDVVSPDQARSIISQEMDSLKTYFLEQAGGDDVVDLETLENFWMQKERDPDLQADAAYYLMAIQTIKNAYVHMSHLTT